MWGESDQDTIAIGPLVANLRRLGALGKDPDRAETRAEQLTEIDRDRDCPWPLDWQRHHRALVRLTADEPDGKLPDTAPGVVHDGDDLGTWITRQRRAWPDLSDEQRTRLIALGITPPATETVSPPARGAAKGEAVGVLPAGRRGARPVHRPRGHRRDPRARPRRAPPRRRRGARPQARHPARQHPPAPRPPHPRPARRPHRPRRHPGPTRPSLPDSAPKAPGVTRRCSDARSPAPSPDHVGYDTGTAG
ncbi:helicase associated domain-containing protein [Streptomyces roseolus]|uniref:helicase associated domain-containing protein n=1 Tax=Streptomyces roseolus TaxID=67358 RepID=UPI003660A561